MVDRLAELQIFSEVYIRGDFSAAARSLNLTPSAVSKAVSRLETRLGARLLERTSRRMRPTLDGDSFFAAAQRAIGAVDDAEASVSGNLSLAVGSLRVYVPPTFGIYQLALLMPSFREKYPKIRVTFLLGNAPLELSLNHIDLAFSVGRPADSDVLCRRIASSRWITCAAPKYIARRGRPKDFEDLVNHDCLGFTLDETRAEWFHSEGFQSSAAPALRCVITSNNGSMLQALARAGVGIVRLAEYHVAADVAAGRLVPVFEEESGGEEEIFALFSRKMKDSMRLRVFLDHVQAAFADSEGVRWPPGGVTETN